MESRQWQVGDVRITKIVERESRIPAGGPGLPGASLEELHAIDWLVPQWMDENDAFTTSVHSLLVETPDGRRIVVDTGIGNDKPRRIPSWNRMSTDFLERFERVWPRESVDIVLCTHLHVDHVGWNTMLVDGAWVPTFPNARHCFVRSEYEHWRVEAESPSGGYSDWANDMIDGVSVFRDSVEPVADAGLVTFVEADASITPDVRLMPTAGHTPGHVSVVIESRGERAVVAGDLFHFAAQIARPEWSSSLDHDPRESAVTRRAFLTEMAETGSLVFGSHLNGPTAGRIVPDGAGFVFRT
jgi:glyoxylase-like metal-dependent hydrolase (beta-lactamase superfamily II)